MKWLRVQQVVIWSFAISFFAWAYVDPRFRDAEGFLEGSFCLPVSVGVALIILGCSLPSRLNRAAFWFALALVGQAVSLQLIEAGPTIRYQHYKSIHDLFAEVHPILLIYLAIQTALVIGGLRALWQSIIQWLGHTLKAWQVLGILLVFSLFSAAPSREVLTYVTEILFAVFIQIVNLGNLLLLVRAIPGDRLTVFKQKFEVLFGQIKALNQNGSRVVDRFAVLAAIWVTVLAAMLNIFSYERHPHLSDEVAYLLHARYFAEGLLTLPVAPVPAAFELDLMQYEQNRWYSPVPPGWPAVLAVGVLLGVPWLVNPMLAGLNILLTYVLLSELYDRRTARMGVVLLCVSPWYVFMAMNFMTHTLILTCALLAAVAVVKARKTGGIAWALVGGFGVGMLSLTRPLDGLIVAGLLGLWTIGVGVMRLKPSSLGAFILGIFLIGWIVFPYNKLLTGSPVVFPLTVYTDKHFGPKTNALGFGPDRGFNWPIDPFPGHGPRDVVVNAMLNTFSVNTELFGWSTGSLILMALMVFSKKLQKSDYLMLAVIVAVLGTYSLYWFSGGPDFGARYWYLIIVPVVALTVRGIQFLEIMFRSGTARFADPGARVVCAVLSLCLLTVVNYFPWRAIDKYHHYLRMRPDMRHLTEKYGFEKGLVLIQGDQFPDYASAAVYNPLDLRSDMPVFVWDRNPVVRAKALGAYPDRRVWVVDGPTITHGGFKVIKGPVIGDELLLQKAKVRQIFAHD